MLRVAFVSLLFAGGLSACSQPCDNEHLCALNSENALCDGNSYVVCTGSTKGTMVSCQRTPKTAVCSPTGWTFENASH